MNFLLETLRLGVTNLRLHKLRSLLTALGIIIGVAAVIAMVAYTEGKKQRALADIAELGSRNVIVRSVKPPEPKTTGEGQRQMLSYGLKRADLRRIAETVTPVRRIVPLKQVGSSVTVGARKSPAAVLGTTPELPAVTSLAVARGRYLEPADLERVANVAVVGAEVADRLFPLEDPLGSSIRVEQQVFRVVGVLRRVGLAGGAGTALVGRDLNFDVHVPLSTARARFGDMIVQRKAGAFEATSVELSEIYIQMEEDRDVPAVAAQVSLLLEQGHAKADDVTTVIPLELLEQAERTQRTFNAVIIVIASLTLLVGGIGIMNIMLASVTERTREIGIRRALGATRRHVIAQFLIETTVLSGVGGLLGVALGLGGAALLAILHEYYPAIEEPHVPTWVITASFSAAVGVGIVFGLYPAVQAARQDPIVALRHD